MNAARSSRSSETPGTDRPVAQQSGHWLLASIGKKVLRPGGRETTEWLLAHLSLPGARVVELAPGLGTTARDLLAQRPASYVGVEEDPVACRTVAKLLDASQNQRVVEANAKSTGLDDASADVVIGEAMLTMQGEKGKRAIMAEAARILRPDGLYAIHELGLTPDTIDEESKTDIRKRLARSIHVNARPLTMAEWSELAEEAGFAVVDTYETAMGLLDPKRMLADEGALGVARIVGNLIRKPDVRARVMDMRTVFRDYADHLAGVGLVLKKKGA